MMTIVNAACRGTWWMNAMDGSSRELLGPQRGSGRGHLSSSSCPETTTTRPTSTATSWPTSTMTHYGLGDAAAAWPCHDERPSRIGRPAGPGSSRSAACRGSSQAATGEGLTSCLVVGLVLLGLGRNRDGVGLRSRAGHYPSAAVHRRRCWRWRRCWRINTTPRSEIRV
jgi:hypothetical protein